MLPIQKEGIVISTTELTFENEGVLNPAAILDQGYIHLFYRAVKKGNHSSIGYCKLNSPMNVIQRNKTPLIVPEYDYEKQGVEDPRIVKIDHQYFLSYTAYDGINAMGALAISEDLKYFEKQGIIVPKITYERFNALTSNLNVLNAKYQRYNYSESNYNHNGDNIWVSNKNVIFFPRRINGKICFLQRIKPDVQIVANINSLSELTSDYWNDYFENFQEHILLTSKYAHEVSYLGAGCPPVETASGWLLIYHGVYDTINGYVYSACAALLDLDNPTIEIARLPYPLFKPELEWELTGEVNNVCFPTGAVCIADTLFIYYGAADTRVACASINITLLIAELLQNKISVNDICYDK